MADNSHQRRIDEELVCADALSHVLRTKCGCHEVHAERLPNDPPDFSITIDGATFPTEVTSIVSRLQYHEHCKAFKDEIRNSAASLGILHGNYTISVLRLPEIPKPSSARRRQIVDTACAYIDATKHVEQSPESCLWSLGRDKICMVKFSNNRDSVELLWMPPAKWGDEIESELASMMQDAVDIKTRKLARVGIGAGQAILLLYDAYGIAEAADAMAAIQRVSGCDWFHSIFWAASFTDRPNESYPEEPGRHGLFLSSTNANWNGAGTVGDIAS